MDLPDQAGARTAIENLLFTYSERIDRGDFAGVGELFSRARMLDPRGRVMGAGKDEVRAIYERVTIVYDNGTPMTQHVTTNVILALEQGGRTAAARSRFSVMQALPDFPLQCIITGHYEDRFAHDASDGWHFSERCMKPGLLGDLSRHLRTRFSTE